jgi:hypothetical protein
MKRAFRRDTNSVFIITCDNLGEYFAEFAKYRNSLNKENEWDESLIRIRYKDKESIAFFENDINNQIVDFLQKDYDNVFGGRNGRIELVLPVDLKSSE